MAKTLQNFYKSTITLDWTIGTGNFYVAQKPVPTDGWLVLSPNNATTREIVKYTATGTDANGDYITVTERGVDNTDEQTHTVGEPIRMNITKEYWDDMQSDIASIVASGVTDATTTTMGGVELATSGEMTAGTDTSAGGHPIVPQPSLINSAIDTKINSGIKFGGNSSDGALSITSGTTTINVGGSRVYELNYSSISITGTGKLAFTNPHANGTIVVIKCKGNCTLTSSAAPMIDVSGMGSAGGTGGNDSVAGGGGAGGNSGTSGTTYGFVKTNPGIGNTTSGAIAGSAVGTFAYPLLSGNIVSTTQAAIKYSHLFVGAGGGGGYGLLVTGSGNAIGGNGGNGGGCLVMEVFGAINFTTTNGISVAGANGGNGTLSGSISVGHAGGGGGGGGGCCFIFYGSSVAFTGTINISGGSGGTAAAVGGSNTSGGGSAGGSAFNTGSGNAGSTSVSGDPSGGVGGAGYEIHETNNYF